MKVFSCRHKNLKRIRAHKQSETGIQFKDKAIIVDKFDCLIFIQCEKCKEILSVKLDDTTFDKI